MNEALKVVLSMSFSGSIVIALLLPFLRLFHNRFSRKWQYYICLVAVFRLLVPLAPQENLVNALFQAAGGMAESIREGENRGVEDGGDGEGRRSEASGEEDGKAGAGWQLDGNGVEDGKAREGQQLDGSGKENGRVGEGQQLDGSSTEDGKVGAGQQLDGSSAKDGRARERQQLDGSGAKDGRAGEGQQLDGSGAKDGRAGEGQQLDGSGKESGRVGEGQQLDGSGKENGRAGEGQQLDGSSTEDGKAGEGQQLDGSGVEDGKAGEEQWPEESGEENAKTVDGQQPDDADTADGQQKKNGEVPYNVDTAGGQQKKNGEVPDNADTADGQQKRNGEELDNVVMTDRQPGSEKTEDAQAKTGSVLSQGGRILSFGWLAWMVPACFLFVRKLILYRRFVRFLQETSEGVQDIALLEEFGRLAEKSRIRKCLGLYVNSQITSPMLAGFFHPYIVLPVGEIFPLDFEYTILHELVHYKRGDMLYKWLVQFSVCIHWFNPLVYILRGYINKACELSCDEGVIRELDAQGRYAYGDTLLRAAGKDACNKNTAIFMAFGRNKETVKERLDAIMNYRKGTKAGFVLAAVLAATISLGASYAGVYAAERADEPAYAGMLLDGGIVPDSKNSVSWKAAPAVKAGFGASQQAKHSVVYKEGEYFILFDGRKELPASKGPDYGVTFTAVWKDSYVSFNSYYINKSLLAKMEKECTHMQKKGWLTKKESNAVLAVAAKVQAGDTAGFQEEEKEDEYAAWGIQRKNGAYYYKNKRVRIFMELRAADKSFENFMLDRKGEVDVVVIRGKDHSIKKVKYLSGKKARKIVEELG